MDDNGLERICNGHGGLLLLEVARLIPKVELHAHLHGCIRSETLQDLVQERGIALSPEQLRVLAPGGGRSLSDCFTMFAMIHSVVSDLTAIRRIALETLQDMQRHNVRYAELRTTPRTLPDGTTRRQCIETVLEVFREFEGSTEACSTGGAGPEHHPIGREGRSKSLRDGRSASKLIPRLLLSVDRNRSVDEGLEVAELAAQLKKDKDWGRYVLGVDFSGNPTKGSFQEFRPAFDLARNAGLKVTVHCGETPDDADTQAVIDFNPERLGHAVVLGEAVQDRLLSLKRRIPIEICPTSNLLTLGLDDHDQHPTVARWIKEGYPFSLNTDDSGVFRTDLPTEYAQFAASQGIDKRGMIDLALRAVEDIFDDELKPSLAESFRRECETLLSGPGYIETL